MNSVGYMLPLKTVGCPRYAGLGSWELSIAGVMRTENKSLVLLLLSQSPAVTGKMLLCSVGDSSPGFYPWLTL